MFDPCHLCKRGIPTYHYMVIHALVTSISFILILQIALNLQKVGGIGIKGGKFIKALAIEMNHI